MTMIGVPKYNMSARQPMHPDESGAANGAVTSRDSNVGGSLADPENPAMWLLLIGAITIGLVGFSTHARVGNVSAGFEAGET